MAGKVMGQVLVLARCQIVLSEKYGCVLKIGVRSENEDIVQTIISLLHWCVFSINRHPSPVFSDLLWNSWSHSFSS